MFAPSKAFVVALGIVFFACTARGTTTGPTTRPAPTRSPEVNFNNIPLKDCFDFVRDATGVNLHVNWRALEAVGVSGDTLVNMRIRGVTVRKVLDMLLTEAAQGGLLTFYVDQGVIEVTTRELADAELITKVYPVEDLIVDVPDFEPSMDFDMGRNTQRGGYGGNGGGYGGAYGGNGRGYGNGGYGMGGGYMNNASGLNGTSTADPSGRLNPNGTVTRDQRGKELEELIVETVRTDVWSQNGGPASIRYFNGKLIVTAPRSVHEIIGGRVN